MVTRDKDAGKVSRTETIHKGNQRRFPNAGLRGGHRREALLPIHLRWCSGRPVEAPEAARTSRSYHCTAAALALWIRFTWLANPNQVPAELAPHGPEQVATGQRRTLNILESFCHQRLKCPFLSSSCAHLLISVKHTLNNERLWGSKQRKVERFRGTVRD